MNLRLDLLFVRSEESWNQSRRFSTKVVPGLELEAWLLLQGAARWRSFKVSAARACTAAQTPANILIGLTLVMFRRWEVARASAFGTRRGEERSLRGTSGAMLACLGVRACVFRPAALLQRGHAAPSA